uniref:Zasp-like motif domain-containing protein n=1 Tax=Glossina austeni TaxID=7395 RepID=A0A1A9UG19_GLOAU
MSSCTVKLLLIVYLTMGDHCANMDRIPKKRQIYREQVLPHAGGRVPDTAFETERLFLNQLQKDGISVPDGVVPEQRNPQVYPFLSRPSRKVFRVALSSDGRFTPEEGRYRYHELPSIETTYLFPQIHGQKMDLTPQTVVLPNVIPLRMNKIFTKSKSYQNFNIIHTPTIPKSARVSRTGGKPYLPTYKSDQPCTPEANKNLL